VFLIVTGIEVVQECIHTDNLLGNLPIYTSKIRIIASVLEFHHDVAVLANQESFGRIFQLFLCTYIYLCINICTYIYKIVMTAHELSIHIMCVCACV